MALDPNLAALLTLSVSWESKNATDGYGAEGFAAPVTLLCYPVSGSMQIQHPDGTVYVSNQALHFDGNDSRVATFKLGDRFTSVGIAGGQTKKAVSIDPTYSPGPSLNAPMTPWLVEVRL